MVRFFITAFCALLLSTSFAYAGFQWVPPSQNSQVLPAKNKAVQAIDPQSGFAPAPVSAVPLDGPIAPSQVTARLEPSNQPSNPAPQKRNLSGKKLVIDPYPLRNNIAPPQGGLSKSEMHQAMNETSGVLNRVQLGNGMKTSGIVRPRISLPLPERMASTNTALALDNIAGMTPMIGGEPAPLHGVSIPRNPNVPPIEPNFKKQMPTSQGNFAQAIGFGRELPLDLALSQVIPSGFTHSFANNVDTGISVSWEGGKAWNVVLNEMLRPSNLVAVVQGKQVVIQPIARL